MALAEVEVLLDGSRTRVATLESELAALQADVAERQSAETPARTQRDAPSHLRLVPLPAGYALSESAEPPPRTGELVEIERRQFSVAKIGRSPLPGDLRLCAFLLVQPGEVVCPSAPEVRPRAPAGAGARRRLLGLRQRPRPGVQPTTAQSPAPSRRSGETP